MSLTEPAAERLVAGHALTPRLPGLTGLAVDLLLDRPGRPVRGAGRTLRAWTRSGPATGPPSRTSPGTWPACGLRSRPAGTWSWTWPTGSRATAGGCRSR
jgi:hypothetical protein